MHSYTRHAFSALICSRRRAIHCFWCLGRIVSTITYETHVSKLTSLISTGWQLWRMFIGLDSTRYPLRTYGDIAFRVYGSWARHGVDVLQSIQLVFNVGIIVLANGQGLSQVAKGKVCFSVLCVIWTVLGAILGQIRTLQRLGWIAK